MIDDLLTGQYAYPIELARRAPLPAVRKRYLTIAEHYRTLAEVEKRVQIKKGQTTPDPTRVK